MNIIKIKLERKWNEVPSVGKLTIRVFLDIVTYMIFNQISDILSKGSSRLSIAHLI